MIAPALLLALLTSPGPSSALTPPDELVYALADDIDSLDPHWAYDAVSYLPINQVYENLIDFEGASTHEFEPTLASLVPTTSNSLLSKDGLSVAFPIRKGVRFHDGSTMTPEDVKYSLMRFMLLDRDTGPSQLLLKPLTGRSSARLADGRPDPDAFREADRAVSVEAGAVVLRLKKPFVPLLSVLAQFAPVVSKSFVAAHGGWDGTLEGLDGHQNPAREASTLFARADGTGPFRLSSWDRAKRSLALERHAGYWGEPAGLPKVRILSVEDSRPRRRLLWHGNCDIAVVERRYLPQFQPRQDVVLLEDLPSMEAHNVLFLNQAVRAGPSAHLGSGRLDGAGVPPDFFADLDTRRGFREAFDYARFIREGYQGKAQRAHGPIPPSVFGWVETPPPAASAARAEQFLRRAHQGLLWEKGFLLTVAWTKGRSDRRLACKILKEAMAAIQPRFKVRCLELTAPELLAAFKDGRLSAFIYRWALDYPDPHNAVEPFLHSAGVFASKLGYSNPRADRFIEEAASEPDPARRKELYFELQALAGIDVPYIFTVDAYNLLAHRKDIEGWIYNPIEPLGRLHRVTKRR
ncbi:MAG: hypothetical protein HY553_02125 [Elusimicrobia bacterium]|nr:hypothetical protein [Elusimicrobiota bacterium]